MATPNSTIIQLTAPTHFPIKLIASNFTVWRKQVQSTLIGLDLYKYLDGTLKPPSKVTTDKEKTSPNPDYLLWFRQDQILISALLGSCSDSIQPIISSADTAQEAWERLNSSYASASRSRIISLKSKLVNNPRGNRSITDYLHSMRAIADDLALAQNPVTEEDLLVHILSQLGDEYTTIAAALKVRDNPISYPELFDKLLDFERSLKATSVTSEPLLSTVNYTNRQPNRFQTQTPQVSATAPRTNRYPPNNQQRNSRSQWSASQQGGTRSNRTASFCHYCNISGHHTKDCRKLSRFLKENHISVVNAQGTTPTVNVTTSGSTNPTPTWLFDSGASNHVTSNHATLHNLSEYGGPDEIVLGDGKGLQISHIGQKQIYTAYKTLNLPNVLYVPKLRRNLISVAKLCKANQVSCEFFPTHFFVKDLRTGARLLRGENTDDVYHATLPFTPQINHTSTTSTTSFLDWHHKLGHPSIKTFVSIIKHLGLTSKSMSDFHAHCASCSINKSHKLPFGHNSFVAKKPLQLVYSDVWGPVQSSIDNFKYYVIFVDFFSKYVWLYPLKRKSDVATLFPQFKLLVEKFFGTPLVSLFTDNGGEYQGLTSFLQTNGISHFTTPPHTPEQNGTAERRHRHIVETGLALLHYAGLPLHFWTHAFQTAVYLINRLPTSVLDFRSPFELLFNQPPNYSKLKSFGCLCYPWLRPYTQSKLQPRSSPCIFLGYSQSKSAYKCFDPKTNRLYHSRHVEFFNHLLPYKSTPHNSSTPLIADTFFAPSMPLQTHISVPPTTTPNSPTVVPPPLHTSHAPCTPSSYATSMREPNEPLSPNQSSPIIPSPSPSHATTPNQSATFTSPSSPTDQHTQLSQPSSPPPLPPRHRKPNPKYFNSTFVNTSTLYPIPTTLEPTTYTQAMKIPDWRKAMDSEFNALITNDTWELVPPSSYTPISCKWLFRVKRNPDGSVAKYKARLVAKGFQQQYGKDYFDTFSPVTKPVTIRTVLSIAISKNWSLRQLDVNNAFLHGTLNEEVFMIQPPGYIHPNSLTMSANSKNLSMASNKHLVPGTLSSPPFLPPMGFTNLWLMHLYLSTIRVTSHATSWFTLMISYSLFVHTLSQRFSIKDLGSLHHFLGIEVISTASGLSLSQHRHIQDLLTHFHMDGAKEVATPLSSSVVLTLMDGSPPVDLTPYRKLVGSLQYLAFTRPDVSFAVNKLSQFMHAPSQTHWQALKRVLRYLKGTIHHGLFLKRATTLDLKAFSDSDWGGISTAGRSTTAYLLYLGGNIISWRSAKQKSVSRSSTEAEYKALANAAAEVSWVQNLLHELGITTAHPPTLYCDNTGATYLCSNPVYHSRMKHVALDYHFVREKVTNGSLRVLHINSTDQLADALTKSLPRPTFLHLRSKIGVSDGSSILRGRRDDELEQKINREFKSEHNNSGNLQTKETT
ncbi:hypothetical protein OSB04_018828 [Centaurea solstitialis]|uniref:Integrase catalytic domain-containing protein n=1 Tax=Centaurea solstitialis TaxID=347529 RepID=A0AA38SP38_9ASTR|nr:hypothetical protein OSB04_018828 [Centaurea solstitialis]